MNIITVEQPNEGRTFTYYATDDELENKLDRIRLAFNMEHTNIEVRSV